MDTIGPGPKKGRWDKNKKLEGRHLVGEKSLALLRVESDS